MNKYHNWKNMHYTLNKLEVSNTSHPRSTKAKANTGTIKRSLKTTTIHKKHKIRNVKYVTYIHKQNLMKNKESGRKQPNYYTIY